MIPVALPGALTMTLTQALMGADPAPVADPAAGTAGVDFAMMMAGLAPAVPPAAADDAADAGPPDDATRGKDGRDDDDAQPQDAALLAMLALAPQPATPEAGTPKAPEAQSPATISSAARAVAAPPTASAPPAASAPAAEQLPAAAPVAKAMTALKLKLTPAMPDGAPIAGIALAAIVAETRPADATTEKPADDGAGDAPDAAPIQPADAAAAVTPTPILPTDQPRAAHVTGHAASSQATLGDALGERQLSLAQGSGWLDQLARDISSTAGVEGKLHFRLNPEHLGSLHVEMTRGAEGAAVRLTADTPAARDILVDAQPQLVAEARAQGVRIAGTHVDLGSRTASDDGRRQAQGFTPQVRAIGAAAATIDTTEPRGAAAERYA